MKTASEVAKRDAAKQTRNALANAVTVGVRTVQGMVGKELGKSASLDLSEIISTKVSGYLEEKRNA